MESGGWELHQIDDDEDEDGEGASPNPTSEPSDLTRTSPRRSPSPSRW